METTPDAARGSKLSRGEIAGALAVFTLWLLVFAGGILVNTRPSRLIISPEGVAAFEAPGRAAAANAPLALSASDRTALAAFDASRGVDRAGRVFMAWVVIVLWFLPINLALLCAVSGTLGAFGNRANLQDDGAERGPLDASNPYVSALLRGFCVYLVMISGLLLLDDDPFSNPSPGQYIRLAGFLSLFSFVVNYNPQVFGRVVGFAVKSIEAKASTRPDAAPAPESDRARAAEVAAATGAAARLAAATGVAATDAATLAAATLADTDDAPPEPHGDGFAGEPGR